MTGTRAHGGAVLAALLAAHGVRHVFGVPGGQTLALYDAMLDPDVAPRLRHILVRDERTAAYAADGYARVTGRVGVCDATVGPGAAKLPSGLGEALGASVPILALVSELPASLAPHRYRSAASQALDQAGLLAPVTKWQATVPDMAAMPGLVGRAFREATTGRPGPVALLLPQDVLDGAAGPDQRALVAEQTAAAAMATRGERFGTFPAFRPQPDPADVTAAAAVLARAGRPFLLAGGGVLHSRAGPAVTALAERLSAAVATTLSGKGTIAEDHPLSVGVVGSMGTAAATAALAEADVVLLAGAKASSGSTLAWTAPRPDQAVLQLDVDPAELGRAFCVRAALLGDARAGLEALTGALGPLSDAEPDRVPWRARLAQLTAGWRQARDLERSSDAVPIAPQRVVAELERVLGPDDILVCDASLASGWAGVYLEQRTAGRRVLSPRGLAGLGYAVPAAIGVATADRPGRVVALAGDGALGYAVGELATLAQFRLPVAIVVLNNRSLAWIRWYRRVTFGRGWEDDDFADVAFADVARGFGLRGERVTQPQLLGPALRAALSADGPSLIDVVTDAWQTPIAAHRHAVEQGAPAKYGG